MVDPAVGSRARQDWGAAASLRPGYAWVPARIAARRHRDREGREERERRGRARSRRRGAARARARSAWTRMPAPSSPCAASPAPAPSTTTATTPRLVRARGFHRLIALFVSVQRLIAVTISPLPFSVRPQRRSWACPRRGSGRGSRASALREGIATRASRSI